MFPDITSLKAGDLSPLSKVQKDTEGRSANIPKAFPFFLKALGVKVYVVVNFLSQVIFLFLLFLGMLMYANEV